MKHLSGWARPAGLAIVMCLLSSCVGSIHEPPVDPDAVRARIARGLPGGVTNPQGWAIDIFAAFEALEIEPTPENVCAVIAVTAQESTFQVNPSVPGLPAIALREIDARAARYGIPKFAARAALEIESPNGKTYAARIERATTEKALSDVFEDFIGMVPLGSKLFADWNPVRTGGPMQVSIAYAAEHAQTRRYPYPIAHNIRGEVFTRRGGMYFGIAHLLDYPRSYDAMLFTFADYNAGHYASRNAALQNAVNIAGRSKLTLDGDLLLHGEHANTPSNTELAIVKLAPRLELSASEIRRDLERGDTAALERTRLYERIFALADGVARERVPRAVVPKIRLESPKITRSLTTEWFANRVNERHKQCLSRITRSG